MPGTLQRFSSFSAFQGNFYQILPKFFYTLLLVVSSLSLCAQTATWIGSSGGGDFQVSTNWSTGITPVNGSSVIIASDLTGDITNVPAITLTNLNINGNCSLAAAVTGSILTVTGNFTIASGKTFALGLAGQRLNFVLSSFATGTIAGIVQINSGVTVRYFQNDGDLTITPTGLIVDDGINPSAFFLGSSAILRIGSVDGITASPTLLGNIQVVGTRDYQSGATYAYVGTASQTVGDGLPSVVSNLIINNSGGTVSLVSSITISNTLTVSNGTFGIGTNNISSVNAISMTGTTINGTGTINLNGNVSTSVSASTATINPPIALGGSNRTFNVASGSLNPDLQINSSISGAGVGVIKSGAGILTLAGNNSFNGTTQINNGTVKLGASGSAGNGPLGDVGGSTIVSNGAVLDVNGFTLSNNEPLTLNGSGIAGNGVLTNSGANASFGGLITLGSGSTIASTVGTLSIANTGTITGSGFTLTLSGTGGGTINSIIGTGAGLLIKSGSGTWTLTNANTYSGGTVLSAGVLNINNSNALGSTSGTFTINGGSFDNTSGGPITTANYTLAWNGDFTFLGTNALDFGNGSVSLSGNRIISTPGSNNLRIGGTINAPSFNLTKNGAGPLITDTNPITLNSLAINSGTFTAPTVAINLTGDLIVGAATFNNNGGTVNFTGSSSQAVAGVTYQTVNFSGAGQKNATGNITVNSTLTNTAVLNMGVNNLTAGTINNAGGTIQFGGPSNGFAINAGTIVYNGPSQTVGAGAYNNLTISQSSGVATLATSSTINGVLNFTSGNLNVGTNVLTLGNTATITGANSSRFIIATGGGEVRKNYTGAGSFTFPIGDNSGVTEFSPVTVNFTSGNPLFIGVSVIDAKHPNNGSPTNFLNRYWNIATGANGVATITSNYPPASIVGTEASISAGQLTGTFNQTTNPWIKFTALGGGTLTAAAANLLSAQPSIFTGIVGASPIANAGADKQLCNSTNTTIGGAPTASAGAGGYIYSWSPSTNLSATNIANPTFTATTPGTTTFTVTVTDANGFISTDAVDVTVDPLPSPVISGSNSVCDSQTGVPYSTTASGNTFSWSITGGTIVGPSNGNSIVVNWGTTGTGTLQLTETIGATSCSVTTALFNVTINPKPTPVIVGPSASCANQTGLVYTTTLNVGRSYSWNVSGGTITAGAGTNSITVTWGATGAGTVNLIETISATGCFTAASSFPVTINPLPVPSIIGNNSVCANQSGLVYSTSATGNTFAWTISGGTIIGATNTNSIVVNWGGVGSGSLQLTETIVSSSCSVTTSLFNVTISPNPTPSISGPLTACASQTGLVYSTTSNIGRAYSWNVTGGTITAGAGTNSITVTWGAAGTGLVNLTETISATGCFTIAPTYSVTINPLPTPTISGPNAVCVNQTGVNYSTPPSGNIFSWSITGGTITGSTTSNGITVDWGGVGTGTLQLVETILATSCTVTTTLYNVTINPPPSPLVSGASTVCANAVNVGYSTPLLAGRTYSWNVIGGSISGPSNGNSILVNWGGAGPGTVQVTETITATGCSANSAIYNVTISPNPTPLVTGLTSVCANQLSVAYSTTNVGGNSYVWIVTGGTISSGAGTNAITVDWGASGAGTVLVQETITATTCSTTTANYNVTINPNPTPVVSGLTTVCANRTGVIYSTPFTVGRTYLWTISGGTITAGSTTASATVTWGAAGTGTIQVTETIVATGCATTTSGYSVLKNPNPTPVVSGPNAACVNTSGLIYSTPLVTGNTYSWSLPGGGGTITAGGATDQVTVTWTGSGARTVRVTETITATGCNVNSANFNVTVNANPASAISGASIVCSGQNGVVYSTPANAGRNYVWTVTGGTIASGASSASITINWGAAGVGTVQLVETVIATGCTTSTPNYNVTINPSPTPSISGLNAVCAGQTGVTYSTTNVGGNSYVWSVSGGSITSGAGTNSIVVSWGVASGGTVTLTETIVATGCAVTPAPYAVTINPNPTPFIVGTNNVCANQNGVTYSTAFAVGRSYSWVVAGGTIASGAGTNSIQVNWGSTGTGTVHLTETVIASSCSVTTPTLNVFINAPPTPAVTGISTVCANQLGVGYSTPSTGNIYFWSVSGGSISSGAGTSAITANWGALGTGTINLTEISLSTGCITATTPFSVTINPLPAPAILGSNSVCAGDLNKIYSTPFVAGNTYSWSVTGGTIIGSSTSNTVSINWGAAGLGTLQLTETITATSCSLTTTIYNVTINSLPTPSISGVSAVCANEASVVYSTPNVVGNTYLWSVSGGSIATGNGTNSITVNWNGAGPGIVSLVETTSASGCFATAAPLNVTINPSPNPIIAGNNTVCAFDAGKIYNAPLIAGNTYSWTVIGGTIVGPSTNNSVTVNWGAAGIGMLTLTETNTTTSCSFTTPAYSVTINATPTPVLTGLNTVCANDTGVTYSTPNIVGDLYGWSVSGGTITSGLGTNSITVNWGGAGIGTVTLTEVVVSSGCSVILPPYNVTINPTPIPVISGNNTVCANDINKVYSTPLIGGNTYSWVVTGGTINGASTGNSIVVDWGAAGIGSVVLTETVIATGCATTTPVYNVNINNLPTPTITGLSTVCALQTGVAYSTPLVAGNSYTWVISGGTITSGAGTNTVTVNWGASGTGTLTLTEAIPASSCSTTTPVYNVIINPIPSPIIAGSNTVCETDQKVYSTPLTVGNTYSWSVTGGTISGSSTNNTVTINWGTAGTGTLQVTEIAGCTTTTPIYNVTINSIPTPSVTGLTNVCANQVGVTYSTPNVSGNTYTWSVVGGTVVSGVNTNSITVNWSPSGSGSVLVTETITASGCTVATSPLPIIIGPGAVINAGADAEVCTSSTFNLASRGVGIASGSNYASITWSGGTGSFSNPNNLNPIYTPGVGETGTVTLTLTATGIGLCPVVLDQMILTITPLPTANAGSDAEICQGSNFGFFSQATAASAGNFSSILWTKSGGTGTIINANTLSPTYQPGVGDSGAITFTLTATSTGSCVAATDDMVLTITIPPTVNAGSNAEVCQGLNFNFGSRATAATATNFNSITWTGGTGTFSNANALSPTYTPGVGETGLVTFTLTATGNGSCSTIASMFNLTITPAVTVTAGSNAEVCQGLSFNFGTRATLATATNFNTINWTGGAGTITNPNTLNPIYTPGVGETGIVTFTLTATGNGSCATQTSTMQLTITPTVIANAGSNAAICQGIPINFATRGTPATASNFNTITWSGGAGTFSNPNALNPTYTPTAGETGVVTFTLTATGNGSCVTQQSNFALTITPAVVVNAGSNAEVCEGLSFNFGTRSTLATASNFNTLAWTGGAGSFINGNTLNPTYIPGVGETGTILFTLTATGNGSCSSQPSTMQLTITPSVIANAGSNAAICQGTSFNFATRGTPATASNFNSITWSGGAGTFSNPNALNPTYTPAIGETGVITFTLTATGNGSCVTQNATFNLTISPSVTVNAGSNSEICSGSIFNFATQASPASSANFSTLLWTHSGTGTIFNANTLTPVYQPGIGETGTVNFQLQANGIGTCSPAISTTQLLIRPAAVVNAGTNGETCQGTPFDFLTRFIPATASNFSSLLWTHLGTGTLSNATTLSPTYTPGAGETGNVTFTLTATGNGVCLSVQSQMILTITPTVVVSAGSNAQICQGSTYNFSSQTTLASASNVSSVLWTHNGAGSLFNTNTLTPTYFASPSETGNVTFTLRGNSTGSCSFVTSTMTINIVPAPIAVAGSNAEVCEGTPTFAFSSRTTIASSLNGTVLWTHNGAGTLSNSTLINPVYTLAAGDFGNIVTFTLTVTSGATVCSPAQSTYQLRVNRTAIANAPADYTVCQSSTIALNGSIGGTATAGLWSRVSGAGTLSATNVSGLSVTSNYTVDPTDVGGTVTFRLTTNDPDGPSSPCTVVFDDVNVTINRAASITAGIDLKQCQDQHSIAMQGSITYAPNGVVWSGGLGSFSGGTTPTATYSFGNPAEINSFVPVVLTLTANDPDGSGPCASVSDQMNLIVNPLPLVGFFGLPASMAENNSPIQLTANRLGGLFSIAPLTSTITSTIAGPSFDRVWFDPSSVTLGPNTVSYTFTDANGCTNSQSQIILVNPVTDIDFSLQYQTAPFQFVTEVSNTFTFCANIGNLKIVGNPPVNTGTGPNSFVAIARDASTQAKLDSAILRSKIILFGSDYFIDTQGLPAATYLIRYFYVNAAGLPSTPITKTIVVNPAPIAAINNSANNCFDSAIVFDGTLSTVSLPATITSWKWKYGDGFESNGSSGLIKSPPYSYANPLNYIVTLEVVSSDNCTATASLPIRVGDVPVPDFNWSAICTNDFTIFEDKTTKVAGTIPSGLSNIILYSWDFGDGSSLINVPAGGTVPPATHSGKTRGTNKKPEHNYDSPGTKTVSLKVDTDDGCTKTITQSIFILNSGTAVTPNLSQPYFTDFESDSAGWVSEGLRTSPLGATPIIKSKKDWVWGVLNGNTINQGFNGSVNAWWTGKSITTNQSSYRPNQTSAVNGPCFDLRNLKRPMISFDYWSDAQNNFDGTVLQYSIDGGNNWFIVGPPLGPLRDEGINWYDAVGLPANPGQQTIGNYGWTDKQGKWKRGAFNLDLIPSAQRDQVRIRFAFASQGTIDPTKTFDGFAFDNVYVGEKNRNVLVEHFTNSSLTGSLGADSYLNGLFNAEELLRGAGNSDFNSIQYHISYSANNTDDLNLDNPNDPNSRASSYGVSQPPRTFMDGVRNNTKFDGTTTKLNNVEIDRRALKSPKFRLKLDTIATNTKTTIRVQLTITADTIVNTPLIAQVALVEDNVVVRGTTYRNVLRKLLFGSDPTKPDGITITQPFAVGQTIILPNPAQEVDINVRVYNPNNLRLIGFVQDKNTGEIYQSILTDAPNKINSPITALEDDPIIAQINQIQIYPNPANGKFNFAVPGDFPERCIWKIADQRGIFVEKGDFADAINGVKTVDVSQLANEVYFVLIGAEGKEPVYRKLVVMNQK